jgi:hypothetical protein
MFNNRKMGSSDSLLDTIKGIMEKKHTTPETPKEKALAKLAHPKDKITHKDVLVGRGVLKKENSGDRMGTIVATRKEKVEVDPKLKEEEQVDERKLTGAETDKKEKYVMSLKKKMGGFKKRYGERAKEVMYATATKMAKEEIEQVGEATKDGNASWRVPAHIKKHLEDKHGTAQSIHVSQDGSKITHSKRHLDDDGMDHYETRTHEYNGKDPVKDRKVGKLIKHVKPKMNKESVSVQEISTGLASRYLKKTDPETSSPKEVEKRKTGRALALTKKWGGKVGGTAAPKVPTKD